MKKLMKIGLGVWMLSGVAEALLVAQMVNLWTDLMVRNEDVAADALDHLSKERLSESTTELKLYEFLKKYMAKAYLNH